MNRHLSAVTALCIMVAATPLVRAADVGNLVRNPGFEADADGNGLPDEWQCRTPATAAWVPTAAAAQAHCVQLRKDDDKADSLWIQQNLPLAGDTAYVVQYTVKAAVGSQYRVYLEWWKQDGTYGGSTTGVANWQDGTGDWQRPMFGFTMPAGAKPPYIVLQLKAAGSVQFDEVVVRPPVREPSRPGSVFSSSFEGGTTAWSLSPGAEIVATDAAEGSAVLRLASAAKGTNPKAFQGGLPSASGKRYRLSFAVKAAGGSTESTGFQYFRVMVGWQHLVKDGVDYGSIQQVEGEAWQDCFASWQRRTLEFTAPAKPTAGMTITCEVRGPGSVLLDDLVLTEVPVVAEAAAALALRLDRPGYRGSVFASAPVADLKGVLTVADPAATKARVTLTGAAGNVLQSSAVSVTAGRAEVTLPAPRLAPGKYVLRATAEAAGKPLAGEALTAIDVLPAAPVEVVLREDNVCLVNGQPFFPIGLWSAPDTDRALYELGRAGFNLVYRTTVTPAVLDRFARYNLKAVAGIRHALPTEPAARRQWEDATRTRVDATRQHPALLGYFLIDEPLWCGAPLEPLMEVYRFHRQLDPYRPIWSNEAPRGTVADCARYAQACDITGVDIYPVPEGGSHSEMEDKTLTSVGRYAEKMRQSVADRKPVWMALQGFAWKHLDDRKAADAVYPTWEQSRFMAYDAILHGAAGITYWGTHTIYDPDFWTVLFRVASELRDLSRVFVAPSVSPALVTCTAPGIAFLHKVCDGQGFLIVANEGKESRDVALAVPYTGAMTVLFENRAVAVRDGALSDRFGPNEVHVYATTAALPPPLVPVPQVDGTPVGEGLRELIEAQRDLLPYAGKANWIWFPGKSTVADSACFLRRTFDLRGAVRRATLIVAADDECALTLNGRDLPTATVGWSRAEKLDVATWLRPGRNVLAVRAKDGGAAPCGFLLELTVNGADGTSFSLLSDADWRAAETADPGWEGQEFDDRAWRAAEIVAPYGGGAWGRRVLVHEAR